MKSLLVIVAIAGIASVSLVTTEFAAVSTPAPVFMWYGTPFRPIGFNYYPCMHPWTGTWEQFNATELAGDMALVRYHRTRIHQVLVPGHRLDDGGWCLYRLDARLEDRELCRGVQG
jgi:hypothetical protein